MKSVPVPASALEARFIRHYGIDAWRDEGHRTRDGVTPVGLFWYRYLRISSNMAFERVSEARAIGHSLSQAFAKDVKTLPESLQVDLRAAYLPVES